LSQEVAFQGYKLLQIGQQQQQQQHQKQTLDALLSICGARTGKEQQQQLPSSSPAVEGVSPVDHNHACAGTVAYYGTCSVADCMPAHMLQQ
jgi:hypothetical protein